MMYCFTDAQFGLIDSALFWIAYYVFNSAFNRSALNGKISFHVRALQLLVSGSEYKEVLKVQRRSAELTFFFTMKTLVDGLL